MKILIVEDSINLRKNIALGLLKLNFVVDSAENGEQALAFLRAYEYDVVLLDIMLPKLSGLEVLKRLRDDRNKTGVIMLTARDDISDRVKGLEMGADDYLCKPFAFQELVARINTIARRNTSADQFLLTFDNLLLDFGLKEVSIDGKVIIFTPTEYAIVEYLALNAGIVVSFQMLEDKLRNSDGCMTRNALEVNISNIRKKLKHFKLLDFIKTKRGSGYFIDKLNA